MTDLSNVFTILHKRIAVATAITMIQLKAGSGVGFEILRAWVTQHTTATPAMAAVSLIRKTTAATVTTAAVGTHILKHGDIAGPDPALELGTAATGITASAEGTDGQEPWSEAFCLVNGVLWFPEKERIYVPPGGIIALKFMETPPNQTYTAGITIVEG